MEEYRRFAFLAAVAGHSVSPSEIVDEVWHLHLLYSLAYWNDFCPHVLQKPLHHFPSTGTPADQAKHGDWYARTLDSYQRYFGSPPDDIWPSPAERERQHPRPRHVDAQQVWIIRKPRWLRNWRWAATGVMLVLLTGCAGQTPWPFDLRGPQFLALFAGLIGVLVLITTVIAVWIRNETPPDDSAIV